MSAPGETVLIQLVLVRGDTATPLALMSTLLAMVMMVLALVRGETALMRPTLEWGDTLPLELALMAALKRVTLVRGDEVLPRLKVVATLLAMVLTLVVLFRGETLP